MKINDLLSTFEIFTTNEEQAVLESMEGVKSLATFSEREQIVINNLIRKSLVSKIHYKDNIMVMKNDK